MAQRHAMDTQPDPKHAVRVRDATEEDLPSLIEFNLNLAWETEGRRLDQDVLRRGLLGALRDGDKARYFVAQVQDRTVGQAMITSEWSDWRNASFWWLQSVYVTAPWRRRGVFSALLAHIRHQARDTADRVCGLRLYVARGNSPAMTVYRARGLQQSDYQLYELDWTS